MKSIVKDIRSGALPVSEIPGFIVFMLVIVAGLFVMAVR
jgi:hypothetical protein